MMTNQYLISLLMYGREGVMSKEEEEAFMREQWKHESTKNTK